MRNASRLPRILIVVACLLSAAFVFAAPPAKAPARSSTAPRTTSTMAVAVADLAVASLTVELVSTTFGPPGVEFPADTLKITGLVKDNGGRKFPSKFRVTLSDGTGKVLATRVVPAPTAAGQTWSVAHSETFSHDVLLAKSPWFFFKIKPESPDDVTNNIESIKVHDPTLHRDGKQVSPAGGGVSTTTNLPGGIAVIF